MDLLVLIPIIIVVGAVILLKKGKKVSIEGYLAKIGPC